MASANVFFQRGILRIWNVKNKNKNIVFSLPKSKEFTEVVGQWEWKGIVQCRTVVCVGCCEPVWDSCSVVRRSKPEMCKLHLLSKIPKSKYRQNGLDDQTHCRYRHHHLQQMRHISSHAGTSLDSTSLGTNIPVWQSFFNRERAKEKQERLHW